MSAKALQLMKEINKVLGSDVVKIGSDKSLEVKYITTGLLPFDILMPGGLPQGRVVEIYGGPSSLKSYIGLCSIAANQRDGKVCALIDTEHTFDPSWAKAIGVDLSALMLQQPDTGELALDTAEVMVRGGVDLLIFDSVAAALPQKDQDKRLYKEKIQPGTHAMMFSRGLRKITAANVSTAIIFINQTRVNIGVTFGNPETTPGGKALPFYASLRMRVQHAGKVNEPYKMFDGESWVSAKRQVAQKYRATMEKSKLSTPYGEVSFVWSLEDGHIDMVTFLLAQGVEAGIITTSGQLWTYKKTTVRGRQKFIDLLAEDDDLREALTCDVREHHGLTVPTPRTAAKKPVATKPGASKSRGRRVLRKKTAV